MAQISGIDDPESSETADSNSKRTERVEIGKTKAQYLTRLYRRIEEQRRKTRFKIVKIGANPERGRSGACMAVKDVRDSTWKQ